METHEAAPSERASYGLNSAIAAATICMGTTVAACLSYNLLKSPKPTAQERGSLEDVWVGATAMHLCVIRRNYEGVKLLQKAGLGGTTKNSKGQSALEFAQLGVADPSCSQEQREAYERIVDLLERNLSKFCAVCGALPSSGQRLQKCDRCKLVCYCGRDMRLLFAVAEMY